LSWKTEYFSPRGGYDVGVTEAVWWRCGISNKPQFKSEVAPLYRTKIINRSSEAPICIGDDENNQPRASRTQCMSVLHIRLSGLRGLFIYRQGHLQITIDAEVLMDAISTMWHCAPHTHRRKPLLTHPPGSCTVCGGLLSRLRCLPFRRRICQHPPSQYRCQDGVWGCLWVSAAELRKLWAPSARRIGFQRGVSYSSVCMNDWKCHHILLARLTSKLPAMGGLSIWSAYFDFPTRIYIHYKTLSLSQLTSRFQDKRELLC
jgi:hypothetical protein